MFTSNSFMKEEILSGWLDYSLMDRALCLVIAKVRVRFPVKPEFFEVLF